MTSQHLLAPLIGVVVVGVGAQWLAWRLKWPAIVLLALIGLAVGVWFIAEQGWAWYWWVGSVALITLGFWLLRAKLPRSAPRGRSAATVAACRTSGRDVVEVPINVQVPARMEA